MQLPVSAHELYQSQFMAYNFKPMGINPNLAHLDFSGTLYNAMQGQGLQDPLRIFTYNLLSANGFQNDRWQQLLNYYGECISSKAMYGGNIDPNGIANAVIAKYTTDQLQKYPELNNVLSHPAREHYRNLNHRVTMDLDGGQQPTPQHQGYQPQSQMHPQQHIHGQGGFQQHPPQGGYQPQMQHNAGMQHHGQGVSTQGGWGTTLSSIAENGSIRKSKRKRVNLIDDHVSNKFSNIHELSNSKPDNTSAPGPVSLDSLQPAMTNDDWYNSPGKNEVISPEPNIVEQAPVNIQDPVDEEIDMDLFQPQIKFYEENVKPLELPGIITAAGMYVYPHEVMRKIMKKSRKQDKLIEGFIPFWIYNPTDAEFTQTYIKESTLDYDKHELVPQRTKLTNDDLIKPEKAQAIHEVNTSYKTYLITSERIDDDYQAESIAKVVNDSLREKAGNDDLRLLSVVQYAKPETVKLVRDVDDSITALTANELISKYNSTSINLDMALNVQGVGTVKNLNQIEPRVSRRLRGLIDNFICDNDICNHWDHAIEDLPDIRKFIKQETIGQGLDVDGIIDTMCKTATKIYPCPGYNLMEDITVTDNGDEVSLDSIDVFSTFYLDERMTGYFNTTSEDLGLPNQPTGINAEMLSSATNSTLYKLCEDLFGTGYAFCDDKPNEVSITLKDDVTVVVYRALEGRIMTYRIV